MKKIKFFSCLLSSIISLGLLCSCSGTAGPQGPQGIQGPQGEQGPAGKDGSSFLTGKGQPANDLGNIGDSYLNIDGEEWGFYIKDNDGWKLLGFIETEPAPPTLSDFNGSYELSHVVVINLDKTKTTYNIGDNFYGMTLTSNMIQAQVKDGTGVMSYNFGQANAITNITYTIEKDKFIMLCEEAVDVYLNGNPQNRFELSIVQDGETYLVLTSDNFSYFVKKTN